MTQTLMRNAIFKKPNILILDKPLEIESSRVRISINQISETVSRKSILGVFEGKMIISDDFDEPIDEFSEYM